MLDLARLQRLGRPIHYHATIDSTMREAAERAERGEPAGTVVIAGEQTAGRGRLGRSWLSEPETGLYLSLILRPRLRPADAPLVTLALALGAGRALHRACGLPCDLRWPNDVLLNGRKCCGILAEMAADGDRLRHVVAGIGVNVNHPSLPEDLAASATSLRIETGCEYSREDLLGDLLAEIDRYLAILEERGGSSIVELFLRASSYAAGRRVVVVNGASQVTGTTAGLTPGGILLLRGEDGTVAPVVAGSVRPAD